MVDRLKALWGRIPVKIRSESAHVALVFGLAFASTARPLLPQLTQAPSMATARALLMAAAIAGARAALPVLYAALARAGCWILAKLARQAA